MRAENLADRLFAYDAGEMGEAEAVELFQELIDAGLIYHLDEKYQRTGKELFEKGLVHRPSGERQDRLPGLPPLAPPIQRTDNRPARSRHQRNPFRA